MINNYICALDIGSSKISAALAQIKKRHVVNIFFESVPSRGVKKGAIINSIDLIGSISSVLKHLKAKTAVNIKFIYANISGEDILTKHSRAIIPLAERGNKVITPSDIERVNEQARILGSNLEEEIIHQIPFSYTIDSKEGIINPLGLYTHRLESDLYLICGKLSSVQNLIRSVNQAGYEIRNLFFGSLVASRVVFTTRELEEGFHVLCDIGKDITEILFFKDGLLKDIKILALGGDDLTVKLAEDLKIPFELAEELKISHGIIGDYSHLKEDKEILVKKNNIYRPIKHKTVSEILTPQAKAICNNIREAIEKNGPCDHIDNFVVIGRTVLVDGFLETLEHVLGISVKLGRPAEYDTALQVSNVNPYTRDIISWLNKNHNISGHQYLNYITCLGLIFEALGSRSTLIKPPTQPARNFLLKTYNNLKDIYQEYF